MNYDEWKLQSPPEEPETIECMICLAQCSPHAIKWERMKGKEYHYCTKCFNEKINIKTEIK